MAVYKVAQDVEADDHLLGPLTPRQFIYLIIAAMAAAIAFFLGRLLLPLAIIPLPIVLFFGMLALPLKKDQPMEVYFAAIISFYLKPRKRFWVPDGLTNLIEITAPRVLEEQRTKDFSGSEAESRLSYLASIVDTEGWAVRHVITNTSNQNTSMIGDVYNDAVATQDPLDTGSTVAQNFDSMLSESSARHRQQLVDSMHNPNTFNPTTPQPTHTTVDMYASMYSQALQPATQQPSDIHFNPYPTIHQSVVQPLGATNQTTTTPPTPMADDSTQAQIQNQPAQSSESTSETTVSPDIIKLVNNSDLSIETIAREAHRIQDKNDDEEVVISLR